MFRRALISLQFVLAGAMLTGCSDVIRTEYATRAAAAEIIQKGWVPSVIPESAAEIREWHDLDTNTGHVTFRFSQDDAASFQAALVEHATRNPATSVSHEKYRRSAYSFYRYDYFVLAIDWTHCMGEFWLEYSKNPPTNQ
jgi:hypothetical protein